MFSVRGQNCPKVLWLLKNLPLCLLDLPSGHVHNSNQFSVAFELLLQTTNGALQLFSMLFCANSSHMQNQKRCKNLDMCYEKKSTWVAIPVNHVIVKKKQCCEELTSSTSSEDPSTVKITQGVN